MTEPVRLDCTGLLCPLPVIQLGKQISASPIGALVELLSDDPAAAVDVPAWCRMTGQELVVAEGGRFLVRRIS